MKRQTEHSPEERNPSVTGRESISGPGCPGAWPHPPSHSGTTGSRSSRSPPPGTAAWCSPSADTYEPVGSETRPGERRDHGCPDGHGLQGHPLPMAGAELRLSSLGEEKSSEEELLEGPWPVLLFSLRAQAWPWLRAAAEE